MTKHTGFQSDGLGQRCSCELLLLRRTNFESAELGHRPRFERWRLRLKLEDSSKKWLLAPELGDANRAA
jgi:hypothetical protein